MDRTRTVMSGDYALPPELVMREAASLRALARSLALDAHAADDVVQETWVRALTSPPTERERIGGWLRRVVLGFASKRRRSEARRSQRERLYARERPEATSCAHSRAETLRSVVDAVLSLDEPYRETVLLRWFEGLPPRDIAVRQGTTVATVNSRLQRAHARLRERLSRELDVDERDLRGALLAIFGLEGAHTIGAAASLSFVGMALMTTKLITGAAIAALVLCAFLYFDRSAGDRVALLASKPEAVLVEPERATIDVVDEGQSKRSEVGAIDSTALLPATEITTSAPHAYDVTFVVLDETGRPRPRVSVWMGPEMERVADIGATGWNGELCVKWRSFQPSHDFVIELRGAGIVAGSLRRITLGAGAPERMVIAALSDGSLDLDAVIVSGRRLTESSADVRHFGFGLTVGEPTFGIDSAGNGVITDPWLLNGNPQDELRLVNFARASMLEMAVRYDGGDAAADTLFSRLRVASEEPSDHDRKLRGHVVDDNALPIVDTLVSLYTEAGARRRDVRTDAEGAFEFTDLKAGRALVYAGGGAHVLRHEAVEDLRAGGDLGMRFVCAKLVRTPLKLLDTDGNALAKWRIEARRCDRNETFVDCVQLDDTGAGSLAIPTTELVRLYAFHPEQNGAAPLLLDRAFLAQGRDTTIVLRDDLRPASYAIDVHARAASDHGSIVMRLWRVDSAMGMYAAMVDVQALDGGDTDRSVFRGKGLISGDYILEFGARGAPWKQLGPFHFAPGAEFTIAPLMLEDPARVNVSTRTKESRVTYQARTLRQGLRVQSPPIQATAPAQLFFTAGEYELTVTAHEKSAVTHTLNVSSDTETALEIDAPQ